MRINWLRLDGYKRMMLNNIQSFTIKPTSQIQLILGTNGCGKSSLLGELTANVPNAADFTKDGSKTINIINRGHNYLLRSTFIPSTKHSFQKDNEELNPGGTATVQRELIKQELHLTPEIHELLRGEELFHAMSPARRREWFTLLCDTNYDYALMAYGKLKERLRDTVGALKEAKRRLVSETSKSITLEEETKLTKEVEQLHFELNLLLEHRSPVEKPLQHYQNALHEAQEELVRLSNRLLRIRLTAPYGVHPSGITMRDEWGQIIRPSFTSIEDIDSFISVIKHDITATETVINTAMSEHSKLSETMAVLTKTGEAGVKELTIQIEQLRESRNEVLRKRRSGIESTDPVSALNALNSVQEQLTEIFSNMPENTDKRYSQAQLQTWQQVLFEERDNFAKLQSELRKLVTYKEHYENHKSVGQTTCPKCQFSWLPGFSEDGYKRALFDIETKNEQSKQLTDKIKDIEDKIKSIEAYGQQFRDYMRCVKNWPVLNPFWDTLATNNTVNESPLLVLHMAGIYRFDLQQEIEAKQIDEKIVELQALVRSAEQIGDANLSEVKLRLEECAFKISEYTTKLTTHQTNANIYIQHRQQLMEALELGRRIKELHDNAVVLNSDMIESLRRDTLNHGIRQLQLQLANKQQVLSEIVTQKAIIDSLQQQIVKLSLEEESLKMLVQQLSPTDGLIAQGLMGFIRTFIQQMNILIRKIWSYPLQVLNCGAVDSQTVELDYKFPLMVREKSNVVSDVSKGSSGMCEIVDLAFKVVAMSALHLGDYPLYLDEFAKTFDEEHRVSAMQVIKTLMDTQGFTQLFMVSHYEASYGSFTQAEVCVICPENITIPESTRYNSHVTIQ